MRVSNSIRQVARRNGLTMAAVSRRSGISYPRLNVLATGTVTPRMETAAKIAAALGVAIHDVWDLDGLTKAERVKVELRLKADK